MVHKWYISRNNNEEETGIEDSIKALAILFEQIIRFELNALGSINAKIEVSTDNVKPTDESTMESDSFVIESVMKQKHFQATHKVLMATSNLQDFINEQCEDISYQYQQEDSNWQFFKVNKIILSCNKFKVNLL